MENDEVSKRAREYIDGLPETKKTSQSSKKTASKPKCASQTSKTSSRVAKTSGQRKRELLIAQHQREDIERQSESMLRLAQQKQEPNLQWLKQEEERMKKEQALIFAEQEEDDRSRLAEATLAELELIEIVSKTNQSLREAFSELSTHRQSVKKSVRLNNWVNRSRKLTYSGARLQSRKRNAPRV